jgi:hypothetical protein
MVIPKTSGTLTFQILNITLLRSGNLSVSHQDLPVTARIQPSELEVLELPADLDWSQGILLLGAAPILISLVLTASILLQYHSCSCLNQFCIKIAICSRRVSKFAATQMRAIPRHNPMTHFSSE